MKTHSDGRTCIHSTGVLGEVTWTLSTISTKEIASGSYRTTSSGPIYVKLEFGGKRGERRRKKFEEIISSLFSKLDENYKPTDPRNAINCKHKENKENYTNTHQLPQIS